MDRTFDVVHIFQDLVFLLSWHHTDHRSQWFFQISLYDKTFCVRTNQFVRFLIWQEGIRTWWHGRRRIWAVFQLRWFFICIECRMRKSFSIMSFTWISNSFIKKLLIWCLLKDCWVQVWIYHILERTWWLFCRFLFRVRCHLSLALLNRFFLWGLRYRTVSRRYRLWSLALLPFSPTRLRKQTW